MFIWAISIPGPTSCCVYCSTRLLGPFYLQAQIPSEITFVAARVIYFDNPHPWTAFGDFPLTYMYITGTLVLLPQGHVVTTLLKGVRIMAFREISRFEVYSLKAVKRIHACQHPNLLAPLIQLRPWVLKKRYILE